METWISEFCPDSVVEVFDIMIDHMRVTFPLFIDALHLDCRLDSGV